VTGSPIRVALDVTPMLGAPTGIHRTTAGLIGALSQRPDVDVGGYVLSVRSATGAPFDDLTVRSSRFPAALAHRAWARTDWPSGRWLAGACDVIHGTNYTVPPARSGRVVTVHDLAMVSNPEWATPAVNRMIPALERAVARGAHVQCPSRATAAEIESRLAVDVERLHVVPNAVSPLGPGDPERGRAAIGADTYVLALGTTEPRKGLTLLPRAIARAGGDATLAVVGPVGSDEAALEGAVADAGIAQRFRRIIEVNETRRSDIVRGAAVLAYPSRAEGFGLPPLEALTVGCPVVATAVGALPELIGDAVDLIPPDDTDALVAALDDVLRDRPAIPDALSDRLLEMTWDRVAAEMVEIYRRSLAD